MSTNIMDKLATTYINAKLSVEIDSIWNNDEKLSKAIGDMLLNDSESRRAFLQEISFIAADHTEGRAQSVSELGIATIVHEAVRDLADELVASRESIDE